MKKVSRQIAFTLVELLVAIAIFATVTTVVYTTLNTGLKAYNRTQTQLRLYQEINQVFDRIALELRNCYDADYNEANSTGGFIGEANQLSFFTIANTYAKGKFRNEIARITYQFKDGKALKRQQADGDAFLDSTQGTEDELISDIKDFHFSYLYFDHSNQQAATYDWRPRWTEKAQIPQGVCVEITRVDPRYNLSVTLKRLIFIGQGMLSSGSASDTITPR